MKSCVDLPIVNDNVLELDESFHVSLERIQALNNADKINRIHITSAKAEINIIDDDGGDCTYVTCSNARIDRYYIFLLWGMHVTLPLLHTAPCFPRNHHCLCLVTASCFYSFCLDTF